MHVIYTANSKMSRRITAHRQTWFSSGSLALTGEQKKQMDVNIKTKDQQADARWKDDFSAQRANMAIYDLIDAQNVRARRIADAADADDDALVKVLKKKPSPIKSINEMMKLSGLPIVISVRENEELVASKSGSEPYSIAELSDGERNALLVAANVLTVAPGTLLLIDEPERHLHRSIISPLLTLLFKRRVDCAFIVSTHDVSLPLDNPSARTLLVRGCTYGPNQKVTRWDVDVVPANAAIDDGIKKDILGSRRKVLFVEGDDKKSLDKPLYSLVFPEASVIPKGGCAEVEAVVKGIADAQDLNWVRPFGIVDNDRRLPAEIERLRARGVYATDVHSVESIYYHPEIQQRVANRQEGVTGQNALERIAEAKRVALQSVVPHARRLSARAIEKTVVAIIQGQTPTQAQIAEGRPVNIAIDVAALVAAEVGEFQALLAAENLEKIVSRYSVRDTPALDLIANRLGFQDREQYEQAVRKLLMDEVAAVTFVRGLFGPLAADIAA